MALRAAYENGRAAARHHIQRQEYEQRSTIEQSEFPVDQEASGLDQIRKDDPEETILDSGKPAAPRQEFSQPDPEPLPPSPAEQMIDEARALLDHPFKRNDVNVWAKLLDDDRLVALDDFADFENLFLRELLSRSGYFGDGSTGSAPNTNLTQYLFHRFGWRKNDGEAYSWLAEAAGLEHAGTQNGEAKNEGEAKTKKLRLLREKTKIDRVGFWAALIAQFTVAPFVPTKWKYVILALLIYYGCILLFKATMPVTLGKLSEKARLISYIALGIFWETAITVVLVYLVFFFKP